MFGSTFLLLARASARGGILCVQPGFTSPAHARRAQFPKVQESAYAEPFAATCADDRK